MTLYNWYWTIWLGLGFGLFEGQAIVRDKPEQTLTHYWCRIWALFPSDKGKRFWRVRRAVGVLFPMWLVFHMATMTLGGLF